MPSEASTRFPAAFVAEDAVVGEGVEIGPFAVIRAGAVIGDGTRIGANVVINAGTRIGSDCEIQDGAVLGKAPKLARHSSASRELPPPLEVGDEAVVCCGAIVFAGASLGARTIVGDQAYVRERATLGEGTVVGRGSTVDNDVAIGARVRVQTDVYLTANSRVEDDVFVGPGVLTTNDSTMARHGDDYPIVGCTLRRACRVGGAVVLTPGVEVGEEAFIAAGAVVTRDVAPRAVVMGVPGREVRSVPDSDLLEHWR